MKYLNVPLAQTAISAAVVQFVERDAGIKRKLALWKSVFFLLRVVVFGLAASLLPELQDLFLQQQQDNGFRSHLSN